MASAPAKWLTPWNLAVTVLALSAVFLWPTWSSLHHFWLETVRFSHGHLIVPISAYLVFVQREKIAGMAAAPFLPALLALSGLLFVWLVGVLASVQAIHQVVTPLITWTMLLAVLGWPIARRLILAIAYLYLAIPIWESGNVLLQWGTVRAVEFALWISRVPAFIDGSLVSLPAGAFEVAGGCSGLHYFIISLAISLLYGALWLRSTRNRVLAVVAAVAAALLTNWVRVFLVVYAGYATDMQHYLVTQDHYYFGWVLFVFAMIPYLWFVRRLEQGEPEDSDRDLAAPSRTAQGVDRRVPVALAACSALLIASIGTIYAKMPVEQQATVALSVPNAEGSWLIKEDAETDWRPYYVGATAERFSAYERDTGLVNLYVNLYRGQRQGRELIGYENRIEGTGGWVRTGSRIRNIQLAEEDGFLSVREVTLRTLTGDERVLYFWYNVDGRHVVSDIRAKLRFGVNLLRGRLDAGVVILSASCTEGCGDARQLLQDWIAAHAQRIGVG